MPAVLRAGSDDVSSSLRCRDDIGGNRPADCASSRAGRDARRIAGQAWQENQEAQKQKTEEKTEEQPLPLREGVGGGAVPIPASPPPPNPLPQGAGERFSFFLRPSSFALLPSPSSFVLLPSCPLPRLVARPVVSWFCPIGAAIGLPIPAGNKVDLRAPIARPAFLGYHSRTTCDRLYLSNQSQRWGTT